MRIPTRSSRPTLARAFLLCVAILWPLPANALVISEFMAANTITIADDDGDFSDWVELYNQSGGAVPLDGYYLTDEPAVPNKWRFPSVSLPAGGRLLVWASDKNRTDPAAPLHANFKLSASGEYLALIAPDGVSVVHAYAPAFPMQGQDRSYGLAADLVTRRCFVVPTPAAANDESGACDAVEPMDFSPPRGFFDAPFAITLSTPTPATTIRYTLDGTDPTPEYGNVYSAPIPVSSTTMLRAIAMRPGFTPTASVTHTYIFLDDILDQTTAEQPADYRFSGADYDMDPEVVGNPLYAGEIKDDLLSIPTMSIVTEAGNLFDVDRGIYVNRLRDGAAGERPVSVELLRSDGESGFQINCGVQMQGATSLLSDMGKYSFRLVFKSDYGPSELVYPLFPDSQVDKFDTVTLTSTHNNSWPGGSARAEYIRDSWLKDTQIATGNLASHSTYVHLYLNGRYWGLYRPTERPDGSFMAEHLGGAAADYDALNTGKIVDGDRVAWDTLQELARGPLDTPATYAALRQYLDVDAFIDYVMVNVFAGNFDWPYHNWYAGRLREAGAGFLFFTWDGELILGEITTDRTNMSSVDSPGALFGNLEQKSAEFRLAFADHVHRHLFNGGVLTPEANMARWNQRKAQIYGAIVGESARWGDHARGIPYTRDNEWLMEHQRLLLAYFPARTRIVLEQFRNAGLYPSVAAPEFSHPAGEFVIGATVSMSAPQGAIYYTTDGSDPRLVGGAVSPAAATFAAPLPLTVDVTLKARALSAGTWSALAEAEFTPRVPLRITELQYNPATGIGAEFVELRNVGASPLDLTGIRFTNGIDFTFPSMTLAEGAHVVVVENLAVFQSLYGAGRPVAGAYTGRLDNDGDRIALETASGHVIQDFRYEDAWYPLTDGLGRSLVIRNIDAPLQAWSTAAGWRASAAAGGNPGLAEATLCANGIDDDGDGLVDTADPGCSDAAEDVEDPACNDGLDNDGEGGIDLADVHCSSPSRNSELPDAGDSFLCYRTKKTGLSPIFAATTAFFDDELEDETQLGVSRPRSICLAGDLNTVAAADAQTHLRAYDARATPGQPAMTQRLALRYDGVFGPIYIDTLSSDRILIPTHIDEHGPATPPQPSLHQVDYYRCYKARLSKGKPRYFPGKTQVRFSDAFEDRAYLLRPPGRVCTPASWDGSVVNAPQRHLLCYRASRDRYSPAHVAHLGVHSADELADDIFDTVREEELCVPAIAH